MNLKNLLIKLDKIRGNACVSRREVFLLLKKKIKLNNEKFKVGDIIKGAEVKGYSTFGCFFNVNGELDVLVHLQKFRILGLIILTKYLTLVKNMILK